jgi:pyrimidine deaminase RibD-like protein
LKIARPNKRLPLTLREDLHQEFMQKALAEARKCIPTPTAFCVGCVIVVKSRQHNSVVLAAGYSRELAGNTHAEANALSKARALSTTELGAILGESEGGNIKEVLARADVYTTLEPCSIRTSGLSPCADALIDAHIQRCFIGVGEPKDFVVCEGAQRLKDAGIDVVWLPGMEDECLREARRGSA